MKATGTSTLFHPSPGLCFPALDAASKEELFATLADALAGHGVANHRDALLKTLLEREAVGTTALGHGIAIPHVRSMVVESTAVAFARLARGLDFAAPGGAPVEVVYLLVAPYGLRGALYLPMLGVLAAAAHDRSARRRLLAVESFDDFSGLMHDVFRPRLLEVMAR